MADYESDHRSSSRGKKKESSSPGNGKRRTQSLSAPPLSSDQSFVGENRLAVGLLLVEDRTPALVQQRQMQDNRQVESASRQLSLLKEIQSLKLRGKACSCGGNLRCCLLLLRRMEVLAAFELDVVVWKGI